MPARVSAAFAREERPIEQLLGSWPLLLGVVLALIAASITFDPKLYINGDNVDYIFLARDLRGGDLWPSDKYPPLFPAPPAPVQALFGLALVPQKIWILVFYLGAAVLLARMVARRWSAARAPWALWIAMTLIPVVEYAHYTMSEVPYLFFLLGALDGGPDLGERAERRAPLVPPTKKSWTSGSSRFGSPHPFMCARSESP
ncbi:MAG: hypothetical protein U0527_08525 [Candidatus Eisenbacteria bacterium]